MNTRPFVKHEVRKSVIGLLQRGATYHQAAEVFEIGVATVNRIWRRYRLTGSTKMAPRGGGQRPAILETQKEAFRFLVQQNSDATYDELRALWNRQASRKVSRSVVVRMVKKLGFTLKKKTIAATEKNSSRNRNRLKTFRRQIQEIAPERLVYLDESGFAAKLRRTHARAQKGKPALSSYPCFFGRNITICGAIRSSGPVVMEGRPKSMTRKWFLSFLRRRLFPKLAPGDVVVLDNLSSHKGEAVRLLAEQWSIRLMYLPPYSPELNAIEMVWAWMKRRLRARANRLKACFRYALAGAWRKSASLNLLPFIAAARP